MSTMDANPVWYDRCDHPQRPGIPWTRSRPFDAEYVITIHTTNGRGRCAGMHSCVAATPSPSHRLLTHWHTHISVHPVYGAR